jgi:glycosyltransferase involved in cell wall biosynthesis
MQRKVVVDVIVPALNEAATLPRLLAAVPRDVVRDVWVVDNDSTDGTARAAQEGGARVLEQRRRGYGAACLAGLRHLSSLPHPPDVVVFLDAGGTWDPAEIPWLVEPIRAGAADLVIGSRVLGELEEGAESAVDKVGRCVGVSLLRLLYGKRYGDLSRFRAIRLHALTALALHDESYGFAVEMLVKAAKAELRAVEVPVSYRRRSGGKPKLSRSLGATVQKSTRGLYNLLRYATAR